MDPKYNQLVQYIKAHHLQGTEPGLFRQELLKVGWDAAIVDKAIKHVQVRTQADQVTPTSNVKATNPYPSSLITNKKPRINLRMLFALVVVAIVSLTGIVLLTHKTKSPNQVYDSFITENTKISTFTQKYTVNDAQSGTSIVTTAKTDFTEPDKPNADIDYNIKIDDEKGSMDIRIHIIAINDDLYVNYENIDVKVSDAVAANGITSSMILSGLTDGIELNKWTKLSLPLVPGSYSANDPFSIATASTAINTVLGQMPIGNFGPKTNDLKQLMLDSYTVNFDNAKRENINGKDTMRFDIGINTQQLNDLNHKIISILNLSERHSALLDSLDRFQEADGDGFTVWVDTSNSHPVKVEYQGVVIEYSDFGNPLSIKAPIVD